MEFFYSFLLLLILGFLIYQNFLAKPKNVDSDLKNEIENFRAENLNLKNENENLKKENTRFVEKFENSEKEKNEFAGKNKTLFVENSNLKNELNLLREKNSELQKKVAEFNANEKSREKNFIEKIENLENARKNLDDERARIRARDSQKIEEDLAEKNKIWKNHENFTIAKLREICAKPEIAFNFYENTNLPPQFSGQFAPDFLVEFLGQFIYFDAKFSSQKDSNSYFDLKRLSKIAEKFKSHQIYPTIFFVVPENRISEIKKLTFRENEFAFFIISPAALEPILTNFKKISEYENLENFDPEDREKIVNLIANYDRNISFQNAVNILLAERSIDLMESKENLPENFKDEIATRKNAMHDLKFSPKEIKNLADNFEKQNAKIAEFVSKKPQISRNEIDATGKLFE